LRNAKQSSEMKSYNCAPDKCPASAAIDGDMNTTAVTLGSWSGGLWDWWSAELTQTATIDKIRIYTTKYAFNDGKFNRFSVETGMTREDDGWTVCKREYKMEGSYKPHVVKCDTPRIAKYIRLSIRGIQNLYLTEVKVIGTPYLEICWGHQRAACVSGHNIHIHSNKTVEECKEICAADPQCKSFEYGVPHGGAETYIKTRDCRPQSSADSTGCDGAYYNSDLYIRQECSDKEWVRHDGSECSRRGIYTYEPRRGCDGWPRTSLATCKQYCREGRLPPGCQPTKNTQCNYVIWDDNKDWSPGWCQLASSCRLQGKGSSVTLKVTTTSHKAIIVEGTIYYPVTSPYADGHSTITNLPTPSCARITLEDVSIADAASTELSAKTLNMSNMDLIRGIIYTLEVNKPLHPWATYSLSVVVNVGWCSSSASGALLSDEWVRQGDYFTESHHAVVANATTVITRNVELKCLGVCDPTTSVLSSSTPVTQSVTIPTSNVPEMIKSTSQPPSPILSDDPEMEVITALPVSSSRLKVMNRWDGFPQVNGVGKMYLGHVNDNRFNPHDIITWQNFQGKPGPWQWLGWQSTKFAGKKLRISFWMKFVRRVPARSGNFGLKVYGLLINDFVRVCRADKWCYVERTVVCPLRGDYNHVLLIFDSINHKQMVRISQFKVKFMGK
jgi:hypothetical protein